jgi:hypothetical protein
MNWDLGHHRTFQTVVRRKSDQNNFRKPEEVSKA